MPASTEHYFTTENASAMAKKSWEARRKRIADEKERREAERIAARVAIDRLTTIDDYVQSRLAVTRALIGQLEAQLMQAHDPDTANKLATAIAKLTDVEFALANRPKPANVRPNIRQSRMDLDGPIGAE